MATIARTVHFSDPETGELKTYHPGDEVDDDVAAGMNNPAVFEDPDASPNNDLESLSDEEFYFAADANGEVDPDTFDEQREARRQAAVEAGTGGVINFGEADYSSWRVGQLREEYNRRAEQGVDMPEVDMRDKEALASALTATDDAGVS